MNGTWEDCWINFLNSYETNFDLSSVDLDGSHTPAIWCGECVEHQGRKKRKTRNAICLTDIQRLNLAIPELVAGNHNYLYNIEVQFEVFAATLEWADIKIKGLFMNADAGFDSKEFKRFCETKDIQANVCFHKRNGDLDRNDYFDQKLCDQRYAVERTNAWMDSYRYILNRFDTTITS